MESKVLSHLAKADYASYTWAKLDPSLPETRSMVDRYWRSVLVVVLVVLVILVILVILISL